MNRMIIPFIILCIVLVACGQQGSSVKGSFDISGVIDELDSSSKRMLVETENEGLYWISLPDEDRLSHYEAGQNVVIWVDGGIAESSPAQAKALNIERVSSNVETVTTSLPTFNFKDQSFPPVVDGFIITKEKRYDMTKGGFQWDDGNRHVTTDAASPAQIAEKYDAIELSPMTTIDLMIDQNPHIQVKLWGASVEDVETDGNQLVLPQKEGRYIYEALASWTNGEASFTFVVEIK